MIKNAHNENKFREYALTERGRVGRGEGEGGGEGEEEDESEREGGRGRAGGGGVRGGGGGEGQRGDGLTLAKSITLLQFATSIKRHSAYS